MNAKTPTKIQIGLAWLVHLFTASGLVAAFLSILAINDHDWRMAMFWLIIAGLIDGVDGTFARLLKVKKVLPHVNGTTIDTVVDFVNYAVVPAYMLYSAGVFPAFMQLPMAALILVTSALYYGKEGMIYKEMYFIGFPVLWNIVAFYMIFTIDLDPYLNALAVVLFAFLHFVPVKFAYPSRKSNFQKLNLIITGILFLVMMYILYIYPVKNIVLSLIAYLCASYFMLLAFYDTYFKKT